VISEAQVLAAVLMHVPQRVRGLHLFRQSVGMVRINQEGPDTERVVRFGIPGMCDVSGLVEPQGWRVEIECKRYGQNLSEKQHHWCGNMIAWGGIYYLARPQIHETLEDAVPRWSEDIEKLIAAKRKGR